MCRMQSVDWSVLTKRVRQCATCHLSIGLVRPLQLHSRIMNTTIGRLFELLVGPPLRTDLEIAKVLGLDLAVVRARLLDLRRRGVVAGPFDEGGTTTWRSWFPTVAATVHAAERSGLHSDSLVPMRRAWWDGMWASN